MPHQRHVRTSPTCKTLEIIALRPSPVRWNGQLEPSKSRPAGGRATSTSCPPWPLPRLPDAESSVRRAPGFTHVKPSALAAAITSAGGKKKKNKDAARAVARRRAPGASIRRRVPGSPPPGRFACQGLAGSVCFVAVVPLFGVPPSVGARASRALASSLPIGLDPMPPAGAPGVRGLTESQSVARVEWPPEHQPPITSVAFGSIACSARTTTRARPRGGRAVHRVVPFGPALVGLAPKPAERARPPSLRRERPVPLYGRRPRPARSCIAPKKRNTGVRSSCSRRHAPREIVEGVMGHEAGDLVRRRAPARFRADCTSASPRRMSEANGRTLRGFQRGVAPLRPKK